MLELLKISLFVTIALYGAMLLLLETGIYFRGHSLYKWSRTTFRVLAVLTVIATISSLAFGVTFCSLSSSLISQHK